MTPEIEQKITAKLDELGGVPGFERIGPAGIEITKDEWEWWYSRKSGTSEFRVRVVITGRDYLTVRGNSKLLMRLVACELDKARIYAEATLGY